MVKNMRLQDDFFEYINKDWLEKTKIPGDKPRISSFDEISNKNEKLLISILKNWKKDKNIPNDPIMLELIKFYKMASNFEKRDALKGRPAKAYLKRIEDIKTYEDFKNEYTNLILEGYDLPFEFGISQDMKNPELQILITTYPRNILPTKQYYDKENPMKETLLKVYEETAIKLLTLIGYKKEKAVKLVSQTLEFDQSYVEYTMTRQQMAEYDKLYNIVNIDEFNSYSDIDFKTILNTITNSNVESLNVMYLPYMKNFNKVCNKDTFKNIKAWILVQAAFKLAPYLSDKIRTVAGNYSRTLQGVKKAFSKQKQAYKLATYLFSMPFGIWYGKTYFGEEAKKDITHMIYNMIKIYEDKLTKNTWLSKQTIEKAITKLNALGVHVGYPDQMESFYHDIKIKTYEEKGTLVSNYLEYLKLEIKNHFSKYMKPVNKNLWSMPPHMVNAYFSPLHNHIVFPAAILQEPFYSLKQTKAQNYGGIGAVIAHEISHAFDNNGAKFDEKGRLNNWWEEQDLKNFEEKTKQMIDLFQGREIEAGACDGKLTVSENIADAGGIGCAIDALKLEENYDLKDFFENWGKIWRIKAHKQFQELLLKSDVHAPGKLRANVQAANLDEFYQTYDIKEDDKMYIAPEKRVIIW